MSNVPDFMVQGQLLSPRGLTATVKLFEEASSNASAKLYALRGEDVCFGLGINNINVLGGSGHCDEDIYEFCHTEEGGGIPVKEKPKNGGKMCGRDEIDVDGDFVAVDHYHLPDDSSSEDEDNEIAQGGALLDASTPFPDFGTLVFSISSNLSGAIKLTFYR